jgi:hypothetical protein
MRRSFLSGLFGLGAVDTYDIKNALEEQIQLHADYDLASSWSTLGDLTIDELQAEGYTQFFMIGTAGDEAIAVNGDVLVDPGLYEVLKIESVGHAQRWSDVGTRELMKWLKKNGFEELPKYGGHVPSAEQEIQMDFVIRAVAKKLGVSEASVKRVAKMEGYKQHAYWSSSGDMELWAK